MATVDVIIPFYNTPLEFTKAAVESVIAQTFRDWKILLVNDGSNEEMTAGLEQWLNTLNENRVVYVKTKNQGLPAARNNGIRASNSPLIAFLDSDDLWHPWKLEKQVPFLEQNPSAALVHSNTDNLWMPAGKIVPYSADRAYLKKLGQRETSLKMLKGNFVAVNTVLIRRPAAEKAGLFDETFRSIEDKEFWLRLLSLGNTFAFLDETVAVYRQHATNMSKNIPHMMAGRMKLVEKIDKLSAANPAWISDVWPQVRKQMVQHAYHEAVETALDQKQYRIAFQYSLPHRSGVSVASAKLLVKSLIGLLTGRG